MTELEEQVIEWHKKTFKNATIRAILDKLEEELLETLHELRDGSTQQVLEEVADVFIVACALAGRKDLFEDNVTMSRVIADKLEINKARKWGKETENGDRPRVK